MIGIEPQPASAAEAPESSSERTIALPELFGRAPSARVQWSQALPCAALGGAFSVLLAIGLSLLGASAPAAPFLIFGVAFLAGGAWSARLYRRKLKDSLLTVGAGAQLGAASGGFGFLFIAVVVIATVVYSGDEMRKLMADSAPQLVKRGYDAGKMQQMLDLLKTQEGLAVFVAFGLFAMLVMFVVGSSIGGAWYAARVRKHLQR